jgi:hypothetical protein
MPSITIHGDTAVWLTSRRRLDRLAAGIELAAD